MNSTKELSEADFSGLQFKDIQSAWDLLEEFVDDPCVDNFRHAYLGDEEAMTKFNEQSLNGCCGSIDLVVEIGGRKSLIGCNYGH